MSGNLFGTFLLKDAIPLTQGKARQIFQHPHEERLIIKVLREQDMGGGPFLRLLPWLRMRRRYGIYRTYVRQIAEYLELRGRFKDAPLPVEHFLGIVDTDIGLGLVVEKLVDRQGGLAPTLTNIVREHGYSQELEDRVLALRDEVIDKGIITGDMHGGNIVAGYSEQRGEALVIVDGLGDKTLIPINSISRYVNKRSNMRHFDGVIASLKRTHMKRLEPPRARKKRSRVQVP